MQVHGLLLKLPKEIKILVTAFVITLNIGFFTGINFVKVTSTFQSKGIATNYLGNENDENATVMQFKKSEKEILTLIHNHILSLSIIFLLLGLLVAMTNLSKKWKNILMFEPFLSLILTFGGIYILWSGVIWFQYVIMISGIAMISSFIIASILILRESIFSRNSN